MRRAATCALVALALGACRDAPTPTQAPSPSEQSARPQAHPPTSGPGTELETLAQWMIDRIHAQEKNRDATCWTTVRMMESFFAGQVVSHPATLLKIESTRTLVYRLWRAASARAAGAQVTVADLKAVVPAAVRPEAPLDERAQRVIDGHEAITENWRALLSVVTDALAGEGLFRGRSVDVKPLEEGAAEHLAAVAVRVGMQILAEAARSAEAAKHRVIALSDVRSAFASVRDALGLRGDPPPAERVPTPPDALAALDRLTRRNMARKVASLAKWNAPADPAAAQGGDAARFERDLAFFNRYAGAAPITPDGLRALMDLAARMPRFVATGAESIRLDAEMSTLDRFAADPEQALEGVERRTYLSLPHVANAIEQVFPHRTLANGDVMVDTAFSHGDAHSEHAIRLYASDLDAVRDTTLHWRLIEAAWRDGGRPMDPFAAELLAERTSELLFFYVVFFQQAAANYRAPRIDAAFVENPPFRGLLLTRQEAHEAWQAVDPATPGAGWQTTAAEQAALAAYAKPLFEDVTTQSGIAARAHYPAASAAGRHLKPGEFDIHDKMGAGVAVGDFDRDGRPDLYLAGDAGNRLYRNVGDMRFEDVTDAAGVAPGTLPDARQPLFADVDGDGDLDLLRVHSAGPSRLWVQTDGRFAEATEGAALKTGPGAHTATFFDADADGDLDLYVGHYGSKARNAFPSLDGRNGNPNQLWLNDGRGRFREVGAAWGVASTGWTLAVTALDFDEDGDLDLYLANDFGADQLFRNVGGRFEDVSTRLGVDDRGSGMNASFSDFDADGDWDLYVSTIDMFSKNLRFRFPRLSDAIPLDDRILRTTLYLSGNKLLRNDGTAGFVAVESAHIEPGDNGWSWGAVFFDYDNDGDDDFYLANGWAEGTAAHRQRNQMLVQVDGRFLRPPGDSPERFVGNTRGVVAVDLDNDGAVDLVTNDFGGAPRILRNVWPREAGGSLRIALSGPGANTRGVGATVTIEAGARTIRRAVTAGDGYLGQTDARIHVGLGSAASARAVTVAWPGGERQRVPGPHRAGSTVRITHQPGSATP